MRQICDLGEYAYAARREAQEAIDLKAVFVVEVSDVEVQTFQWFSVLGAAEGTEDVEIGEPSGEKIAHAVFVVVYELGAAASDDHVPGGVEVVLPRDRYFKGIGGDDLQASEHDCGGQIGVGYLRLGRFQDVTEVRKDVANPESDPVSRFRCLRKRALCEAEYARSRLSRFGFERATYGSVVGSVRIMERSPLTLRQNALERVIRAVEWDKYASRMVKEMMEIE